jgi:predicted nucleic acid-binding protein
MPVTEELLQAASNLARVHLLRAYDAFHLATLIALKDLVPDIVTVSTWDPALALAAEAEGFSLAHEVIT